ncbi:hypothetical protein TNCV_4729021 [Trichonephila clavipes]|nr:hypothetical protein TNCV_4729021 [Trichonephila clavipes]
MLVAPAIQHLQRSLQPVRDEGRFPSSCRLRQLRNKTVPIPEESSVIIWMLVAPAVQHLQRSLQPVRDEGRFPSSCRLRQLRNKTVPIPEESSVIICMLTRRSH